MYILKTILQYRELLLRLINRNFSLSYLGTVFGPLWIVMSPLMQMLLYTFVFGVIFGGSFDESMEKDTIGYAIGVYLGITFITLFNENIGANSTVMANNENFVKKVMFPLVILPCVEVFSSSARFLINLLLIVLVCVFRGYAEIGKTILIIYVSLCYFVMNLGVALVVSVVGAYIRDVRNILGIISMIILWSSGVFFSLESIPEPYRNIVIVNPVIHYIELARYALIGVGEYYYFWTSINYISIFSLVTFAIGCFVFTKTEREFSDVI